MLRKNFCFFRLSLFSTNVRLLNCEESQHKTTKTAGEVIGVELNPDAVKDVISNAKRNNSENAWFYCTDASDFMQEFALASEKFDVVFMDQPRSSGSKKIHRFACRCRSENVFYIFCNPETLARALVTLDKKGYKVQKSAPLIYSPTQTI